MIVWRMDAVSRRCPCVLQCIFGLLLVGTVLQTVCGSGTVWVKLRSYDNPGGIAANGQCCDGRWGICLSGCDYIFTLCMDAIATDNTAAPCMYGKRVSDKIMNQNDIQFGDVFGGLHNPVGFRFPGNTPRSIALKVNVMDCDSKLNNNDFVDFLRTNIFLSESAVAESIEAEYTLQSRTRLRVTVKVECSAHWYGVECSTHCPPPGPDDHYHCDPITGRQSCDRGWGGENCMETNVCAHTLCGNGGTCLVYEGNEICFCPHGFVVQESAHGVSCQPVGNTLPEWDEWEPLTDTATQPSLTEEPAVDEILEPFPNKPNSDCDTLAQNGFAYQDGTYSIQVKQLDPFNVYCDMSDVGWTVIQQRVDGSQNFYHGWEKYKQGFGNIGASSEYWIGLEKLHHLTTQRRYKLSIQMQIGNGEWRYANYDHFWVEGEQHQYRLHVEGFSGSAGDALEFTDHEMTRLHNGMPFSTFDRDNDNWTDGNCAQTYQSGWWFNNCFKANLNGPYITMVTGWPRCPINKCIAWKTIPHYKDYSLIQVTMKVLPHQRF